jgi:hypothetical protein
MRPWPILTLLISASLCGQPSSKAVTILTAPTLTRASQAPLSALLEVSTDVPSRVSVAINDGSNTWQRAFFDYTNSHSIPLVGFKPGRTNQVQVTVYDQLRNSASATEPLTFITAKLPSSFPHPNLLKADPRRMEPGYTLNIVQDSGSKTDYIMILDQAGEVVWYKVWTVNMTDVDIRQLSNGDLFMEEADPLNQFLELNLLGETVHTWQAPAGHPVNFHDGVPTDHGTILYLSNVSRTVTNFPSNVTSPSAPRKTVKVDDNPVVEISVTNSALLNTWSPLDMLDPQRVTYLTYEGGLTDYGVDNEHANAVLEDPKNHSLVVSLRDQNAVFKFTRSGQLEWILGPPANWPTNFQRYLFTPEGTPFNWNYGQHAPEFTPQGTLLLYNNGIHRASPFDPPVLDQNNHSGAIEYQLNETNMVVSQVWDSSLANHDRIFTPIVGKAAWLPQRGNVLVTYGNITYVNGVHPSAHSPAATMVRIIEYTHDPVPEVVFELSFFDTSNTNSDYQGYLCYRSRHIQDLYPHPAASVSDLVANRDPEGLVIQFSGDPSHTYLIQASSDLANWAALGLPVPDGGTGEFAFKDLTPPGPANRYYRVVTE